MAEQRESVGGRHQVPLDKLSVEPENLAEAVVASGFFWNCRSGCTTRCRSQSYRRCIEVPSTGY